MRNNNEEMMTLQQQLHPSPDPLEYLLLNNLTQNRGDDNKERMKKIKKEINSTRNLSRHN